MQILKSMAEYTARNRSSLPKSFSYGELSLYIMFAHQKCSTLSHEISVVPLDKKYLPGPTGKAALAQQQSCELPDSVYICAAFSCMRTTHGFKSPRSLTVKMPRKITACKYLSTVASRFSGLCSSSTLKHLEASPTSNTFFKCAFWVLGSCHFSANLLALSKFDI